MLSRIRWRNTGCLAPVLPNTNTCGELTTAAIFHLCVLNYDKKKHHLLQTSMAPLRGLFLFALQSCALLPDYLLSPPLHIKFGTHVFQRTGKKLTLPAIADVEGKPHSIFRQLPLQQAWKSVRNSFRVAFWPMPRCTRTKYFLSKPKPM